MKKLRQTQQLPVGYVARSMSGRSELIGRNRKDRKVSERNEAIIIIIIFYFRFNKGFRIGTIWNVVRGTVGGPIAPWPKFGLVSGRARRKMNVVRRSWWYI